MTKQSTKQLSGNLYTLAPAAAKAGCSVETFRAKVKQGIVTPMQINGGVNPVSIYTADDVETVRKTLGRRR